LRQRLSELQPAMADPQTGPWLRRALVLGSRDGILATGNVVILTQWGLATHEPGSEPELDAMMRSVLGRYLPAPIPNPAHQPVIAAQNVGPAPSAIGFVNAGEKMHRRAGVKMHQA